MSHIMSPIVLKRMTYVLPFVFLIALVVVGAAPKQAAASSHREAPLIALDPQVDNTDVYAFISPENTNSISFVANYQPFEHPEGGPNFYRFAEDALYEIHIDNVGDARSHITYQFTFKTTVLNTDTFLYNTGVVHALDDPNLNIRQTYTLVEVTNQGGGDQAITLGTDLPVPPVNVGSKSMPNYDAIGDAAIRTITNGPDTIKVFAGPRDDPFFIDIAADFDLLTVRPKAPPLGYARGRSPGVDGLAGYNVHSLVLQVPISRLIKPGDFVLGVWATASRASMRVFSAGSVANSGPMVQVSRLGMPLVNELVVPLALKDAFNSLKPEQDLSVFQQSQQLQTHVLFPELTRLRRALDDMHGPSKAREDIFDIFFQGIVVKQPFTLKTPAGPLTVPAGTNVNRPSSQSRQPAEMLRINTAFRPGLHCSNPPNYKLGLLGGDICGFPNGRRLQDVAPYIEQLAVAGAAWQALTGDTSFTFDPALIKLLDDGVNQNDKSFRATFPYLASPHAPDSHAHDVSAR